VVLSKPGKPDYSSPSSFCIIVLLRTVSKILERIMAIRITDLSRASGLIHPHQCGSIEWLSTLDAAITLMHEVKTMQKFKLKVSTLFLDVKGGFDNVDAIYLTKILRQGNLPSYAI